MRSDRASDLHLVREVVDAGGCAPPIQATTERQQDQAFVERQRVEYAERADGVAPLPSIPLRD